MDKYKEKRRHDRLPYEAPIRFTVLFMQTSDFKRTDSAGKIVDTSPSGIGLVTDFPLEAGHVLEWDDKHQKGRLHIAMVRWAQQIENQYRAGLMFI